MLTSKERAKLNSFANKLNDLVFVGINGVTDNVITQVNENLYAHELIKIKVQKGCDLTAREVANELSAKTSSDIVAVLGSKIVLYKHSTKENVKHYKDMM